MKKTFYVFTDGGAKGNPGPGGIGVVVKDQNQKTIFEMSKFIGYTTNNQAEYKAVIEALKWLGDYLKEEKEVEIKFFLDSQLVVNQLTGKFKIKDPQLKKLVAQINILIRNIKGQISYHFIERSLNSRADFLVRNSY